MRRMKMFVVILALVSLMVAGLAVTTSAKTTIKWSFWGATEDIKRNDLLAKMFEKKNPDIEVENVYIFGGEYFQKLQTMIAGGVAPDVIMLDPSWSYALYNKGVLADLTNRLEKAGFFDSKKYYSNLFKVASKGDVVYGLPDGLNCEALFYNASLFDKAGLSYPDETWTWDDYLGAARALTKDVNGDGKIDRFGTAIMGWYANVQIYIWSFGGEWILNEDEAKAKGLNPKKCYLNSPEAKAALEFISDLRNKYHVAPTPAQESTFGDAFVNQRVAMKISGTWEMEQARNIKDFKWDIALIPKGKTRVTTLDSSHYSIYAKTKNFEAAWKFLEFLGSEEVQKVLAASAGSAPIIRSVAESDLFLKYEGAPPHNKLRLDMPFRYGRVRYRLVPHFPEIESAWWKEIDFAFFGIQTVDRAVDNLVPIVEKYLARED